MTEKDRLIAWSVLGAAASFAVAGLTRFIEPGGWAIWPTLGLLLIAMLSLHKISSIIRRWP